MIRAINMLVMQGSPDEEADEVQHMLLEATPVAEDPANNAQLASVAAHAVDDVNMMEISAATYNGAADEATISLLIKLKGVPAIALADTKHKHVLGSSICYGS
jgi:hypothetical protein